MVADPARSRMLAYLLTGEFASAGELAAAAGVSAATASGHLAKLRDSGFLVCEPRGRHRYFRLADGEIAQALQALALVAERDSHRQRWAASPQRQRLRLARCCYGHTAGRVGVALLAQLQQDGRLREAEDGWQLTPRGSAWLAEVGFTPHATGSRRRFAYGCLDWSERRDHLAGSLGSQLLDHFIAQGWLRREADGQRALQPTWAGRQRLWPWLGLTEGI